MKKKYYNVHVSFIKGLFDSWAEHKNVGVIFKDYSSFDNSFVISVFENGNAMSKTIRYDDKLTPGRLEFILNSMLKEIRKENV